MGQGQTDDEGGDDTAQSAEDCAQGTCQPGPHKGGGVDGDRARGHLCNGDQIRKLSHGHQPVDVYDLVLDQRDRGVASAYGEHAHLDEGEK